MDNLNILLEPASIAACSKLPSELEFMGRALQHQVDVFEAAKTHDLILDLAPTGTGKTNAGLSVLLHNRDRNAVYIAPTNALIEQQTRAAEKFVKDAGLPHIVKAASAACIKQWPDDRVGRRSGEKLYNALRETATMFPECGGDRPILLVTNPDIFYYVAFFQYHRLDRSNIASEFYSSFATIIFDEFHLYDAKQLVGLLFYLALSKVFGYFEYNRKVVLLTATPEPACTVALEKLRESGVKIKSIDGTEYQENLNPSQTEVSLEIRPQPEKETLVTAIAKEVIQRLQKYPDRNGAVILDSKDTLNRISDYLRTKGLENEVGRIIGNTPLLQRKEAAQKQVILATSTVDVGFNFEKTPEPLRQNLDWLIFSTRDRFAFWQRIGRVGRVLGKTQTDISSEAIAYLPEKAWEEGIENLDISGGREALKTMLESLDGMKRPFLEIYWRSEAFLEIAKPLLELETVFAGLPQENLVLELYQTLQKLLGGKKDWSYYRQRMKVIQGAINIADCSVHKIRKEWQYIKGGRNCVMSFLRANYEEDWQEIKEGKVSIDSAEKLIQDDEEIAKELLEYAKILKASYSPLFHFRDSLFENVRIYDPHYLLLDEIGETNLDPIHLFRYLEFVTDGERIELKKRTKESYTLCFTLNVVDLEEFKNTCLNKLYAFEGCNIERMQGDAIYPTNIPNSLKKAISERLTPGVIVQEHGQNKWVICKLTKLGLKPYPIKVKDIYSEKDYLFFPSLSGILAIASYGVVLKCPDNEEFWIA